MRPIGRIAGRWTKTISVVAAVGVAAGAMGVGNAWADDSTGAVELGIEIQSEVESQVQTAIADAQQTVEIADATVVVAAADVETRGAAPGAAEAAPPAERAKRAMPPHGPSERPRKSRPRAGPQVRGRQFSRPVAPALVQARPSAAPASPQGARTVPRRRHKSAYRTPPAPFSPTAPAHDPGISWSGEVGGQGASPPPLAAALAALLTLALPFVLRRVIWLAQPVPRRIAPAPWRPG